MLMLKNIKKSYENVTILNDLSAIIEQGDFIVVVGINGSGKTTLFDIIAGTVTPDSGEVIYQNQTITHQNQSDRSSWISRLFQNPTFNCEPLMTVAQNFALVLLKVKKASLTAAINSQKRERIIYELQKFNLESLIDVPMGKLSGGQRQLIAFIMATMTKPKLLLLDEPTAALDPISATIMLKTAAIYNKEHGLTTLLITHDPHMAIALGNKIWVLENGVITKIFNCQDKNNLKSQDLIGLINYQELQTVHCQ